MGSALYGINAVCMAMLAVSADKWDGTLRAKGVDTTVTIIQFVTLSGELRCLRDIKHTNSWSTSFEVETSRTSNRALRGNALTAVTGGVEASGQDLNSATYDGAVAQTIVVLVMHHW